MKRGWLAAILTFAWILSAQGAGAQTQRTAANATRVAVTGFSATAFLEANIGDQAQRRLLGELTTAQAATSRALKSERTATRERDRLQALQDVQDTRIANLVSEIEAQGWVNDDLRRQIDAFAQSILESADAADPRKLRCLEDYGRGLRVEAMPCIRDINAAHVRADEAATAVRTTARLRQTALLAQQMLGRGELPITTVVTDWENVVARSDDVWDTIELAGVYRTARRWAEGKALVDGITVLPEEARARTAVLDQLGLFRDATGDTRGALLAFGEAERIRRRRSEADPTDPIARLDLNASLNLMADIQLRTNQPLLALEAYQESEALARRALQDLPLNASTIRFLVSSLKGTGDARLRMNQLEAALTAYEESERIARIWVGFDPANIGAQRGYSDILAQIGEVRLRQHQTQAALAAFQDSEIIKGRLAESDPLHPGYQGELFHVRMMSCMLKSAGACERLGRQAEEVERTGILPAEFVGFARRVIAEQDQP